MKTPTTAGVTASTTPGITECVAAHLSARMKTPGRQRGFSLIELLTVLAIVAVLAALTLPGFRDQVMKGRRAEAREALQTIQLAQERFRSRSPRYADRLEDLGQPATTRSSLYRLRIVQADATRYQVEAVAQGNQLGDRRCRVLTLRLELGATTSTGFDDQGVEQATACWPQ
ncbi:type IV pilin protein [Roseateles chitinivorans]|uniref:type IV pilin protein n=1 Tax=Roseateles chitinivorans TaxID=2917965 RepID=UPI003D676AA0